MWTKVLIKGPVGAIGTFRDPIAKSFGAEVTAWTAREIGYAAFDWYR